MKNKESQVAYKFTAEDFYRILNNQEKKCMLTGRELTPENTNAEHILPLRRGGKHEKNNICLVVEELSKLKRYYDEEEIVRLAADIINFKGKEYGYTCKKIHKSKKV
ncbi:HNH endonuclease [Leptospira santarosai]|uniref:HNH endonuclease n=1 Tax=Leptospira santarosai TaxID=28183 RepID=UPI000517E21E|nr:hypothetical protein [Leptospira santarosai]